MPKRIGFNQHRIPAQPQRADRVTLEGRASRRRRNRAPTPATPLAACAGVAGWPRPNQGGRRNRQRRIEVAAAHIMRRSVRQSRAMSTARPSMRQSSRSRRRRRGRAIRSSASGCPGFAGRAHGLAEVLERGQVDTGASRRVRCGHGQVLRRALDRRPRQRQQRVSRAGSAYSRRVHAPRPGRAHHDTGVPRRRYSATPEAAIRGRADADAIEQETDRARRLCQPRERPPPSRIDAIAVMADPQQAAQLLVRHSAKAGIALRQTSCLFIQRLCFRWSGRSRTQDSGQQRVDEGFGIEHAQVLGPLADAGVADRDAELARQRDTTPPLAVPSSLVTTRPVTGHRIVELAQLRWRSGRWCRRSPSALRAVPASILPSTRRILPSSAIQPLLRMQAAGGVGDQHVDAARLRRLQRVERDRRGSASWPCATTATPLRSPHRLQLRDRGGAEGVAGGEHQAWVLS